MRNSSDRIFQYKKAPRIVFVIGDIYTEPIEQAKAMQFH